MAKRKCADGGMAGKKGGMMMPGRMPPGMMGKKGMPAKKKKK